MIVKTHFIALLFVVLYSSGYVASKIGIAYTDPFTFQTMRLGIPILFFCLIVLFLKSEWNESVSEIAHIAITGFLIHGICFTGMLIAYEWGMGAGSVGLVMALHPALASIGAVALLGEPFSRRLILGLVLGTVGVVLIMHQKQDLDENTSSGLALTIFCLFSMVAGVLYQKCFVAHMNLMTGSLIQHLGGFIPVLGLMLLFEPMTVNWSPALIGSLLWLSVVLSLGSWVLFSILIRDGSVAHSQSYFFLVPPMIAFLAWLFFEEAFGSNFLVNLGLIVAGTFIVTTHPAAVRSVKNGARPYPQRR